MSVEEISPDSKGSPILDEKNISYTPSNVVDTETGEVEVLLTTKRGLKARHAQMIALGMTRPNPS